MNNPPKVVAVTGASGYIGTRLLQELGPHLDKLVAFDSKPLIPPNSKGVMNHAPTGEWPHDIATYQQDLTQPIDEALRHHGVTTLVHLAYIIKPGRNRREIDAVRQTNLSVLRRVLESCVEASVKHVIYLSSHTVYGAHKDNPIPLTEQAPLCPLPDFPYGYGKFLSEQVLQEFSKEHQNIKVTILRSCVVLGPTADNYITRAFFRPWLLGIRGYDPPLQFLHEDDLACILRTIIQRELPGVFNVAGEGVVYYRELVKTTHRKLVSLPAFLAYPLAQLTWELRVQRDSSSAGLDFIRYPIVVSTECLKKATGYQFQYTSREALTAYAKSRPTTISTN